MYRLVTSGTVDQDIHAIAQRKLRLDAAVLAGGEDAESVGDGKAGKAGAERTAMSVILSSILACKPVTEEPLAKEGDGTASIVPFSDSDVNGTTPV